MEKAPYLVVFICFRCPACGHKLRARTKAAGKFARCKCGAVVGIPTIAAKAPSYDSPLPVDSQEDQTASGTVVALPRQR
jgi:hypothetical protein